MNQKYKKILGEAQSNSQRPIHLPQTVKSRDLCTDLLQWIISTRGLHTAAPAYTRARGALQERGQVLLVSQERLRMVLCRTQPLSHIHEGFHGQRTYLTYKSSSLGMELLLNRATISPYGHCGLTSTSWKKRTFPHIPWLGSCNKGTKTCSSFTNSKISFASGQSCTRSTWSGGKIPPRCNRMTGQEVH